VASSDILPALLLHAFAEDELASVRRLNVFLDASDCR